MTPINPAEALPTLGEGFLLMVSHDGPDATMLLCDQVAGNHLSYFAENYSFFPQSRRREIILTMAKQLRELRTLNYTITIDHPTPSEGVIYADQRTS